jgi:hypothetical protein
MPPNPPPTPPPQKPQLRLQIVINYELFSGEIGMSGPMENKGLCYAALEAAKLFVHDFVPGKGLVIPMGAAPSGNGKAN